MTLAVNLAQGASNNVTFRNRIINGGMVFDQRNAGASVTPTTNVTYTLDRWVAYLSASSKFSVQQNAGSVTPPTGFKNYLGVTSLSAYTIGAEVFGVTQVIEGYNIADLGWGTAGASTVTLSFWVRSSLTGTFGGAFKNSAEDRAYPFNYTISSANTWEQKSITVTGDTSGTWLTTNGVGIKLVFGLGVGSSLSGTAGAWSAGNLFSATGATSVVGTNGATFYITGVQLEAGTTASPFEYRQYGTEFSLCQRYCYVFRSDATGLYSNIGFTTVFDTVNQVAGITLPVPMRITPTITYSSLSNLAIHAPGLVRVAITSIGMNTSQSNNFRVCVSTTTAVATDLVNLRSCFFEFNNTSTGWLAFAAEL